MTGSVLAAKARNARQKRTYTIAEPIPNNIVPIVDFLTESDTLQDGESPINSKADSKAALAFVISAKTKIRGNRQTAFSIFAGPKSCNRVSLQMNVSIGEYFHAAKAVVALAALQVNIKLYVASVSLFNPPLFKESAVVCR